ncbi:MAG: hypothetical protein ACK5AY_01050 [Bacteroidota bacterium]
MQNIKLNKLINIPFAGTLLLATLFIFILSAHCNLYIRPISDDFWRDINHLTFNAYLLKIKDWYLHHNGRYSNSFISLIPFFYILPIYRILAVAIQLLFIYSIKKTIDYFFAIKYSTAISFSFLAFYLAFCPGFYESFMWFASSNHYMFGFIVLVFFLSIMFKMEMETFNFKHIFIATLLVFFLIGSNEVWLLLIPFIIFLFLSRKICNRSFQFLKTYIFLFLFASACLVLSYISPSNSIRSGNLPESKKLIESLIWSFKDFFIEIFHATAGVFSPFYLVIQFALLFLFSCMLYFKKNPVTSVISTLIKNKFYVIIGLLGAILITLFAVKYGQSFHSLGIGRVRNLRFLFNIVLITYLSLIIAYYAHGHIKSSIILILKNLLKITITISVITYFITNIIKVNSSQQLSNKAVTLGSNLFELIYDYKNNRWKKYDTQWNERIKIAKQSQNKDLSFLPLKETPLILENKISSYELEKDSSSYFNGGFAIKHNLKSVKVSDK